MYCNNLRYKRSLFRKNARLMKIYENPIGVLTNNPPFEQQMSRFIRAAFVKLNSVSGVSEEDPGITGVNMHREDLEGRNLYVYPMRKSCGIKWKISTKGNFQEEKN